MTHSEPPAPRDRRHTLHPLVQAMAFTTFLVATIILVICGMQTLTDSPDYSAASGFPLSTDPTSTAASLDPMKAPSQTTSTALPEPNWDATTAANTAHPTPKPFKAPTAVPTAFPTCPADHSGVQCFYTPPKPTPTVVPFPTALMACDSLRTAVAMGGDVKPGWCSDD